jgi:hypothetical protein
VTVQKFGGFGEGYVVFFDRDVSACAGVANPGENAAPGSVAQPGVVTYVNVGQFVDKRAVSVVFRNTTNDAGFDTDFHIVMGCPAA